MVVTVEELAEILHEAGRAAVESGNTVAAEKFGDGARKFIEWGDVGEEAREGRRIQARALIEQLSIFPKAGCPTSATSYLKAATENLRNPQVTPPCREVSLAITKIEEALHWIAARKI